MSRDRSPAPGTAATAPVSTCAVAVDVALLTVREGRLQLLLVHPDAGPYTSQWALPGRRVRDDESLDDTAHRALRELAGLRAPDARLEQLRTYGDPSRDPRGRVVSVAYLALTPTVESVVDGGPLADGRAAFFDVGALAGGGGPPLAYDHDRIVPDAIERARSKLEYTALATAFVAEPFTLGELRRVYEAVWGVDLDAANFRRKVVSARDFVVEVEGTAAPGPEGGRPAKRYRRGRASRLHPAMLRP
ncbi:NUDIX hydrolase [Egicoccus halophilus]|uniref:NUDIX hydrolase n=1 Tax=Egicoccus halophilus TaxID=1670830 RepID=A0A8J3A7X0_9ACTN|nr:NUDIX domain-containing protein [Egicoccus halophilus]GGI06178.1 NUDIX hydrolase [Egicoccus halophilus]